MASLRNPVMDPIESRLAELPGLRRTALCDLWKEHFGASPPTPVRRDMMIPILAYRIQEKAFRSLSAGARNRLRQLAKGFADNSAEVELHKPTLKPGTRLVREWRGEVHLVNVEANGYEYKGGRYKSLSQIARLITGTRWSGPLFFGLNRRTSSADEEAR